MRDITTAVLDFWFGDGTGDPSDGPREFWFKSSPEIDDEIRRRFADAYRRARDGAFDDAAKSADDHLAVVILLDQFPRNMFRGTKDAFATDALARTWAERAIDAGFDREQASEHRRMFFYLPFEHSEDMADQDRACALFEALGNDYYTDYAYKHRAVIAEFGRFPHRNEALGRQSTDAERTYLEKPGAGF